MSGTPDPGFVKLYRRVLMHEWLNDRPEYRVAWEDILLKAEWKTGRVDLSDIPARRYFTTDQWNRYIRRLKGERMIEDCSYANRGGRKGRRLTATISKWQKYHASHESGSSAVATPEQPRQQHASPTETSPDERGGNRGSERGSSAAATPAAPSLTSEKSPKKVRSKEGSLQTDQPLTTDAPPEDLKAAAEAGHCPQDIKDQEWHVWNMTRPDPETHAAWKRLYLSHRDALRLLARLKEQAKARRGTVQQWVLELARDAEENGDACAAALTTALTNPSVGNAWAYYQATYRGRKGTPSRSRAFTAGEFVRDPATLSQGKIVELYQDGSAKLEVGDFWNPDYVTRDITGWEHCDLN